jgi:hypothetical protein
MADDLDDEWWVTDRQTEDKSDPADSSNDGQNIDGSDDEQKNSNNEKKKRPREEIEGKEAAPKKKRKRNRKVYKVF